MSFVLVTTWETYWLSFRSLDRSCKFFRYVIDYSIKVSLLVDVIIS